MAAALLAACAYLTIAQPGYSATAVLLIQPQSADPQKPDAATATPELVRSQIAILQSHRVLLDAVEKLGLARDPDFIGKAPDGAGAQQLTAAALDELGQRLTVENDGRSFTIDLQAKARDPALAAQIANTVASSYIDVERAQKVQLVEDTQQALGARLVNLRDQTIDAELQTEQFRSKAGLLLLSSMDEDGDSYSNSTPAAREIVEMAREHASLAAQSAQAQARYSAQQRAIGRGDGQATADVLGSGLISSLRAREAELAQRRSELLAKYAPDHPLVAPVNAELAQVRSAIDAEIGRIHSSVDSQARSSALALHSADAMMGRLERERSRDLAASTKLMQLQRDAKLKRETYEAYALQMQRATQNAGLQLPDVVLISPASPPLRSSAINPALVLIVAAMAGLLVAIPIGLLRSMAAGRRDARHEPREMIAG